MKKIFYTLFILLVATSCKKENKTKFEIENTPPSKFEVKISNITDVNATISWEKADDPDKDRVFYTLIQNGKKVSLKSKRIYTFNNLKENTSYTGKVIADDNRGGKTTVPFSYKTLKKGTSHTNNFVIPQKLQKYYSGVNFSLDKKQLYDELATLTISKHSKILTYGQRHKYLYDIDNDLNNNDNVVLVYTGESRYWKEYQSGSNSHSKQTFNTEHIYPKSKLQAGDDTNNDGRADAITDLHHLRSCDARVNSRRSNYPFTDGKGACHLTKRSWYPGDQWKGDVARMVMYVNLRYDEPFKDVSTDGIRLLLKWNVEDPVSKFEEHRNNLIEKAQGNRNPFIDNPYLATMLWGGKNAENRWK
ncbi:MAG: endonuclease [Flavobacteriaceae bacterium]|nr:endonuclease [Flavobacteriaceae bacterium]MBS9768006.1 endonuclease [Flavobacteriaceae bacterium]